MSQDNHQNPEDNGSTQQPDSPGSASEITASSNEVLDDNGRRTFLKRAALGGGGALLAGAWSQTCNPIHLSIAGISRL